MGEQTTGGAPSGDGSQERRRRGERLFVSDYHHALDDKGRVVLPAAFRSALADRGYVANLGECIGLWDPEGFQKVSNAWLRARSTGELDMRTFRLLTASVSEVRLDSAGRVTLPRPLIEAQGLGREVTLVGVLERIELWDTQRFLADHDPVANAAVVSERLNQLGIV